jgi:flagellar motor switch protein FliN
MMDKLISEEEIHLLLDKQKKLEEGNLSDGYTSKQEDRGAGDDQVTMKKPVFNELDAEEKTEDEKKNLDVIMDVPLELKVILGKKSKTVGEVLSLGRGSVLELDKQVNDPLEIHVNGKLIALGEVVVINDQFCIRITDIVSKEQRLKNN